MADHSVAQDQLLAFIERIERLIVEKKDIASDIGEVKAEARGNGFDVAIINKIIKIRELDPHERAEQEAILELYMAALGMVPHPSED